MNLGSESKRNDSSRVKFPASFPRIKAAVISVVSRRGTAAKCLLRDYSWNAFCSMKYAEGLFRPMHDPIAYHSSMRASAPLQNINTSADGGSKE